MRFIHRRKFLSLGFKRPFWKPFLIGSAVGIGMAVAEYSIDAIIGGNISLKWAVPAEVSMLSVIGHFLLWLLFLLTLNSLKEELVFRAYPIELFNDHPRAFIWIIIFISLLFAAIHHIIEPFRLSAFLSRFSIAIVFAYAYYRWRSIWLIVGIHNGTNFIGFLLGGMWKSGGLFDFDFTTPSSEVIITVDLAVKLLTLVLIHYVWKKAHTKQING
jgi:membrane protease YdiL (CAAX protease family)